MESNHALSLLGLALRGGNLTVGEEPVETAVRACRARAVLVAADAAEGTMRRAESFARLGKCLLIPLPFTKDELGRALGRSSAALAAMTDTGLAGALARQLAQMDPERYGQTVQKLELKVRRAAERKKRRENREKTPPAASVSSATKASPPPEKPAGKSGGSFSGKGAKRPPRKAAQGSAFPSGKRAGRSSSAGAGARANPYAHSRPVKKGKGSFRSREK